MTIVPIEIEDRARSTVEPLPEAHPLDADTAPEHRDATRVSTFIGPEPGRQPPDVPSEQPAIREESEPLRSGFAEGHDLAARVVDHPLMHRDDVVVTPHSACNTPEAVRRILVTTRENIGAFLDGSPRNAVP